MPNDSPDVVMRKSGQTVVFPRQNLLKLRSLGWVEVKREEPKVGEEEGTLKKIGRGGALGIAAGAGIPETKTPIKDLLEGMKKQAKEIPWWDPTAGALTQGVGIVKNLGSTGIDVIEDIGKPLEERIVHSRRAEKFGTGFDPEKTSHDVASLLTQLLLLKGGKKAAETPLAESTVVKGVKTGSREMLGVGEKSVERARTASEGAAAEKMQAYTEKRAKYDEKVAEAKAEHEAKSAKKVAEHEASVTEAKAKHEANLEAAEQSLQGSVTREAHARLKNERFQRAEKKLTTARNETAQKLRQNLDTAEAAEGKSLDERYNDFRQKILGVSETAPNGTLQSELTPVGQAVANAKKNILKGSKTNIPIFNDIMGRLKDMIETPEGDLRPIEGQMIPTDQLRGYQKEISSAIYEKNLPGDVNRALGHVLDEIQSEVGRSIKDVHGDTAVGIYDRLSKDWTDYKRIWFDTSTVNPLPKIRAMLRDPTVMQEGIPVTERVSKIVKGEGGKSIVRLMAEKSKFGADPKLAANLMALDSKLVRMKEFYEKIPVAKYPRFVKYKEPGAPEIEPFKSSREEPEKPDIERFSSEKFRRETIGKEAEYMSRLQFWDVAAITGAIEEILRGEPRTAAAAASYPILKRLLARGLQSGPVLDFLSKGAP